MSTRERLRSNIELTSPEGDIFTAFWKRSKRDREKKLGIFEYPNFDGTRVDDLGIKSSRYDFSIWFTGEDCDLESERFDAACIQRGAWTVQHPVKGELTLQLVNFTEENDPVEDLERIRYDLNWIEPLNDDVADSSAQLGDDIANQADALNASGVDQLDANVSLETAGDEIAFTQKIQNAVQIAQRTIREISNESDEITSEFDAIVRGINDTISSGSIEPATIAGQVQQLIQLPSLIIRSTQFKIDAFNDMSDEILSDPLGTDADSENKNRVAVNELVLSSIISGMCLSAVSGEITTRTEAVDIAVQLSDILSEIIENLDSTQAVFQSSDIDEQYFSLLTSYPQIVDIISSAIAYLLGGSLNLLIEKRFILDRPRAPIEIAATEYGDPEQIDFFIVTNALKSTEILLLPAGREVVVYV